MAGELGKVYVVIGADTDEIRKALSDFDKKISGAEKKTKDFGDKLKETGEKMQSVARPMLAFGAAITGGLGLAVRAFGNFDAAMNESLAIMGNVSDSMREQMVNAAEDVARTTTFSAKEAAGAFYYLASAGLDAEQSIAALPGVAAFAQSGMMDLETATEYLMDSQSALGLKVADATQNMENMVRVSDVLVEAANVSNGSIEQFAAALSNSAPMMRQLNMDIEEGVGVLSVYADQGIKGEEAGTRFSIVLRDLQTRAIKNKEAFEKYSVAVFDTNGNMRNMADIISDLEKALAGKTDEQKKAILAEMEFQDRSVSSMLSLVGMSKEIGNYEAKLRAAGGTTKDVAEKQLQTLNNQLKLAKNNVNLAAIQIGSQLAPALVKVSKKIADIAKGFSDWSQKHPALSKALTGLVGIIGGTALAGGTLLFGLGAMAKSVGSLINLFPRLGGPLKGLVGSLGKVGAVGAAAFAGWGIGRLIGSVTGLDKAIEKTADKWIDMLGIVKSTAEEGAGHAEALAKRQEWAALAFEKTGVHASTLRGIIDALLPVYKKMGTTGNEQLDALMKAHVAAAKNAKEQKGAVDDLGDSMGDAAGDAANLKDELGLVFKADLKNRIKQIEKALKDYKKELSPESEKALKEELVQLKLQLGLLKPNIENAEAGWSDLEKTMLEWSAKVPDAYDTGADDVNAALDSIVAKGKELAEKHAESGDDISNAWEEVCLDLARNLSDAFAGMLSGTDTFASGMKSVISSLAGSVGQALSQMVQPALASLGALAGPVASLVGGIVGGMVSIFSTLFEESETYAEYAARVFAEAINNIVNDLSYLGDVSDATAEILKNSAEALNNTYGAFLINGADAVALSLHLNDVIRDTGVNVNNIAGYWDLAGKALWDYNNQLLDTANKAELLESLDDTFAALRQAVEEMGQSGSAAMRDFILAAREAGVEIGSVTEYINDQLGLTPKAAMSAAAGLEAMAAGVAPGLADLVEKQKELREQLAETEPGSAEWIALNNAIAANQAKIDAWAASSGDDLNRIAGLTLTTFNAMIANGASAADAMNSIGPTLDVLAEKYEDLGIEAPASIKELLKIRGVQEAHEELFSAVDGNLAVFEALANTGYMTADALADVAANAGDYYDQLIAAGMTSDQALATMAPTLQALNDYATENGIVLDENTQSLIDQAEAAGLVEDAELSTSDAMLAVGAVIAQAFGIDIPEAMQESLDKMNGIGGSVEDAADAVTEDFGGAVSGVTDGPVGDLDDAAKTVADDWKESAAVVEARWLEAFRDMEERAGDIGKDGTRAGDKWVEAARRAKKEWDGVGAGGDGDGGGGSGGGRGGLPEYATGGVAWTPQIASVAERGPEIIMDYGDFLAGDFSGAPAKPGGGAGAGGAAPIVNLSIYAQTLDEATVRRAGEMIYAEVVNQERRRGRGR